MPTEPGRRRRWRRDGEEAETGRGRGRGGSGRRDGKRRESGWEEAGGEAEAKTEAL